MTMPIGSSWTAAHIGLKFPAAGMLLGGALYFALADDPTPMVAITFDDGRKSVLETALPILNEYDMVATHYVTIEHMIYEAYITPNQLKEFVDADWEIGAHGVSHVDMTGLTDDQLIDNLVTPVRLLAEFSGQEILSIATPYGEYDDKLLDEIQSVYFNHVNAWGPERGVNVLETFDQNNIHRLDVTTDVTVSEVCTTVASLPENSLYVLLFHDITAVESGWNTPPEKFKQIVQCVNDADVNVVRVSDGAEAMAQKAAD